MDLIKELEKKYLFHNITNPIIRCDMLLNTIIFLLKDESIVDTINSDKNKNKWLKTIIKPIGKYLSASSKNALRYIDKFFINIGIKNITIITIITIIEEINKFINERIILAHNRIIDFAVKRLDNTNNILIFGDNLLINKIIYSVLKNNPKNIYICDNSNKPSHKMIKTLYDIHVNYLHLNALSYVMSKVDLVLLGCNEIMSNGDIVGPIGTSLVSLIANNNNVPVVFCCETLSFTKKIETGVNFDFKDFKNIKKCILNYDITPSKFVNQIITEKGIIHPLAVHNFL